jgi:hypothetical protein
VGKKATKRRRNRQTAPGRTTSSDIVFPVRPLVLASLLVLQQSPAEDDAERVLLADRTELRGEVAGVEAGGVLRFRDRASGVTRRILLEEVVRLQFGRDEGVKFDGQGEQVRLYHGGLLTGRIASFDGSALTVETAAGSFRLSRADVKSLTLGPLQGAAPELKEEKRDVLIRETEKTDAQGKAVKEYAAEYGRLESLGEKAVFRARREKGEEELRLDRAAVKQVFFLRDEAGPELPPGWFSKVLLKNGDKLVGVLEQVAKDRVRVFSHLFGRSELDKKRIHSITFVQHARMSVGNVLVCDQNGIKELDRQGKEIWAYTQNAQYCWSARKLDNGNVLIANTNYNQVIEVRPTGRTSGEVVWRLDQSNYPYDAVRLDSGNTLVAEYYANRVVEYDAKTKAVSWTAQVQYPISVQRLDSGNTLVCSNYQVVELDREGKQKWKAELTGVRPWRAQRLDNGNTLITDFQRGQVVEIDREHRVVWKRQNLSRPVQALRTDEGNTLILEQGNNRLIEVDPSNPKEFVSEVKGLNYPQGMSTY